MRRLLYILLFSTYYCVADDLNFSISLIDQKSENDNTDFKKLEISTKLSCGGATCPYTISISNLATAFFTVLVDNKECPNSVCQSSLARQQILRVTVKKLLDDSVLEIFNIEYDTETPIIAILGCQTGLFSGGSCIKISESTNSFYDEVCTCIGSAEPYCDATTSTGTCSSGKVTWWQPVPSMTSTTLTTVPSFSTLTTSDPYILHLNDVTISLQESKTNSGGMNSKDVILSASLYCSAKECLFNTTISNYAPGYYSVLVNGEDTCQPTCNGLIREGDTVPVIVERAGQFLKIFEFEWLDQTPGITVLGCHNGLLLSNTCLRTLSNTEHNFEFYDDTVCSCQGDQVGCDYTTQVGQCLDGTPVWWEDNLGSTTSISPVTDSPNNFDLTFQLSEVDENSNPKLFHNVTIVANMNCSGVICQYSIIIVNYAQVYYTIKINDKICPGSAQIPCTGLFLKGMSASVTVTRKGETLYLFDLMDDNQPRVSVLGCDSGILRNGYCQKTQYYDSTVQLSDELCACRSSEISCDDYTPTAQCNDGQISWWRPSSDTSTSLISTVTSTTTSMTTLDYWQISFTISLAETLVSNPSQPEMLSIHTYMTCTDFACSYQITVSNQATGYFFVYVDDDDCANYCESSFQKTDKVTVTIKRNGEILDFYDLKYKNVEILGCYEGYLKEKFCEKMEYSDNKVNDVVCTCWENTQGCSALTSNAKCTDGTTTWWKPDPSSLKTTSPNPTTTSSFFFIEDFTVSITEGLQTDPTHSKTLLILASVVCDKIDCNCQFDLELYDDYYAVKLDGIRCDQECKSKVQKGNSTMLTLQRAGQHLNLIRVEYITTPTIFVLGCDKIEKETTGLRINEAQDGCLHFPHVSYIDQDYVQDDLCVCSGGDICQNNNLQGKCTSGTMDWWINDSTSSSSSTTTTSTTTSYDTQNHFSYDISLSEGRDNKENQLKVSGTMTCSTEECGYSISIDNSSPSYFYVLVGNRECPNGCEGSFLKEKSVNVTVFRGTQYLDLFDFEFTDHPRIVTLGCENGLANYQTCSRITKAVQVENKEYLDDVCSCRSAELDCEHAPPRFCAGGVEKWWEEVDSTSTSMGTTSFLTSTETTSSPAPTTTNSIPSLKDLSNSGVGLNNVTQVLNDTHHYSSEGPMLNRTQIFEITKILHQSANLKGISSENAFQILQNMDSVLNAHQKEIRNGQTKDYRLLEILRPMVRNTKDHLIQYLEGTNLGFNGKKVDCSSIDSDDGLIDYGPAIGFAALNDTNKLSATRQNSIIIPLEKVCGDQEVSHVFFTIYRHRKLFTGPQAYRIYGTDNSDESDSGEEHEEFRERWKRDANQNSSDQNIPLPVASKCSQQISIPQSALVASANIIGADREVRSLSKAASSPIIAKVQFNIGKMPDPLHANTIVSWFNTGTELWELNEQCTVEKNEDGIVTASCEHLTDFSVLIYGQLNAEYVCSLPLIIIAYSVNGASTICLLLLIAISLMFYVKTNMIAKILAFLRGQRPTAGDVVNLSYYCVFFVFFILSLFFMDQSDSEKHTSTTSTYCLTIAAVSYFSFISAIIMSMLIGLRMVCHFLPPRLREFFRVMTSPPAALSIGIIIPFTFTLILALVEKPFFERNDAFCWIRPDYIVYAVVIPVILPIINGLVCSSFAIYKMFFQAKRGLNNKETAHYDAEFWSKVVGLIIMQVAMGLPWGIEFILMGVSGPSPWNYIFVILLSTQGIDLFLVFLYRRQRLVNESKKWSSREETTSRRKEKSRSKV